MAVPPPILYPSADQDVKNAAQRLWLKLRHTAWLEQVCIGRPEACLHLFVKSYHPDQQLYIRNGWAGFRVILHVAVKQTA